ncbi:unnamed protein product [Prunus armeniaca]
MDHQANLPVSDPPRSEPHETLLTFRNCMVTSTGLRSGVPKLCLPFYFLSKIVTSVLPLKRIKMLLTL